jgi:hypothetical protein
VPREIVYSFGSGRAIKLFARELASQLPLPLDVKLIAIARGLQMTGILLCVVNGGDLSRCQCFVDLALVETKASLKDLLTAATTDWTNLVNYA